jgi:HD-GYP domain-containing protein (c-di-GMP phosphodiesterase class II)
MRFDLNRFLVAVSLALDFVEMDILDATVNHTRRVAYISLRIAEMMELSDSDRYDLCANAILHDNGLCEETLYTRLEHRSMDQLSRMEGFREHCEIGERNIAAYPFLTEARNTVKYHHEKANGHGFFGLKGMDIPLPARIVGLADFVDNRFHFEVPTSGHQKKVTDFILDQRGKQFDTEIVDAFMDASRPVSFWLDLRTVEKTLPDLMPHFEQESELEDVLAITGVFSQIVDSKSRFTARHSRGIMDKAGIVADFLHWNHNDKLELVIAASLHDLGKLAIPRELLDANRRLTHDEFRVIQSHTYYTRAMLREIPGFERITEWASNHHEKLNGLGYPYGFTGNRLDFGSRLMTGIDIYQALTEPRPYREPSSHEEAIAMLNDLVCNNHVDKDVVTILNDSMQNKSKKEPYA